MTPVLRAEPAPPSATLLIHMGAGALDSVVRAALRNYGEYRALGRDGLGIFAVSVFAVIEGVTEAAILDALPQSSFARATVGAVTAEGFDVIATSMLDANLDQAVAAIQQAHYDIVLPAPADPRLLVRDPLDDEELEKTARDHLIPHVDRLLALFGPRLHK
jgi:hypothetical protein